MAKLEITLLRWLNLEDYNYLYTCEKPVPGIFKDTCGRISRHDRAGFL